MGAWQLPAARAKTTLTVSGSGSRVAFGGPFGPGLAAAHNGSSQYTNWQLGTDVASSSVLVTGGVFRVTETATAYQTAVGVGGSVTTSGLYGGVGQYGAGSVSSWMRQSIADTDVPIHGPTAVVGEVYAVIRIDRSATDHVMWVNGARYSSSSSAGVLDGFVRNLTVGAVVRDAAPIWYGKQDVALGFFATRDPGDAWAREWSRKPWEMLFAPLERRIWVPVSAAGGGVDLVIADATHAHAADAPTLTTTWLLTVADATHGHAAEAPTLSTEWLLAPADATHAHAADNLTLSDAPALLIAEALHAHTADGVTMTVDAWLVLADATHGHLADNVVLFVPGGTTVREVLRLSSPLRRAVAGSSALTRTVALASDIDAESTTP